MSFCFDYFLEFDILDETELLITYYSLLLVQLFENLLAFLCGHVARKWFKQWGALEDPLSCRRSRPAAPRRAHRRECDPGRRL